MYLRNCSSFFTRFALIAEEDLGYITETKFITMFAIADLHKFFEEFLLAHRVLVIIMSLLWCYGRLICWSCECASMSQGEFPATVQKVYILPPSSFLQKKFADNSLKFLKDDVKFKVLVICSFCHCFTGSNHPEMLGIFSLLDKSTEHRHLHCT